jgi:ankyrin repeat protein
VERYVKKGDPNGKARSGDSMLSWAYKQNNPKIVQVLLDHGANANKDIRALQQAVGNNNLDQVKLLVSRGASVQTKGGYSNQSAIHFARSKEMLEYLLSQGADIRELDGDGQPPGFIWAREKPELWRVFVAHGADPVPRDRNGQSWDEHVQSYNQAEYQRTIQHNEEIRRDNEWISQANENMRKQAEAAAAQQQITQRPAEPECGWACRNAKSSQEALQRMQHDNAFKECIAAGGLNCQ